MRRTRLPFQLSLASVAVVLTAICCLLTIGHYTDYAYLAVAALIAAVCLAFFAFHSMIGLLLERLGDPWLWITFGIVGALGIAAVILRVMTG